MAAFVAKQMMGNKLNAVKGKFAVCVCVRESVIRLRSAHANEFMAVVMIFTPFMVGGGMRKGLHTTACSQI